MSSDVAPCAKFVVLSPGGFPTMKLMKPDFQSPVSRICAWVVTFLLAAMPMHAELTALEIQKREPFAAGNPQGDRGAYERLTGIARFALNPDDPANSGIIDLALAARNKAGKVECWADFEILVPVDLAKANGALFYEVNNRGGLSAPKSITKDADEFLLRLGFVVAASGWCGEVLPAATHSFCFRAPVASNEGKPIRGIVRQEVVDDKPVTKACVAFRGKQGSYRPSERGMREATVTMREREGDERQAFPRDQWRLIVTETTREGETWPLPLIELEIPGGFKPGWIYEVIYEAEMPIVQGAGFAAIRDFVLFLKRDASEKNPLHREGAAPVVTRAIGFGTSQCGRVLRDFLYEGFNADERGRQVFDGMIAHVAGGGLGSFNHRFASPTRTNTQHEEHLFPVDYFPFTYGDETDAFTGKSDGILKKTRAQGVTPKIFHTQTSSEYWNRSGSLVHTDPAGKQDAEIPAEVRLYTFGGAGHGSGSGLPALRGKGTLQFGPTDYRPFMRALVTAMGAWLRDGTEPPPSVYPRIADGTLVDWKKERSGWPAIPGVEYPRVIQMLLFVKRGLEWESKGIASIEPPEILGTYPVLVPAFDADGNERGTLQAPAVRVPLASFTGWNLRTEAIGAAGELLSLASGYIPFPRTREEREAAHDPRPAILDRYKDFADYQKQFQEAADALLKKRYVLDEELPRLKALCEKLRPIFDGQSAATE